MIRGKNSNCKKEIIHTLRSQRVILDCDLADALGIPTHRLNEKLKRNIFRFGDEDLFELSMQEFEKLRSQIGSPRLNKRRSLPYAFTEGGARIMERITKDPRDNSESRETVSLIFGIPESGKKD